MVLEEMLEHSQHDDSGDGDGRLAAVSVRSLAGTLGVAKDTVHRAVTRLRDLGVIEPHQARTASGSFSAGGYRLDVPAACLSILDDSPSAPASSRPPAPEAPLRRAAARPVSDQLSLLLET
jgi:DNA-binding transcriptional MocR family regulator